MHLETKYNKESQGEGRVCFQFLLEGGDVGHLSVKSESESEFQSLWTLGANLEKAVPRLFIWTSQVKGRRRTQAGRMYSKRTHYLTVTLTMYELNA